MIVLKHIYLLCLFLNWRTLKLNTLEKAGFETNTWKKLTLILTNSHTVISRSFIMFFYWTDGRLIPTATYHIKSYLYISFFTFFFARCTNANNPTGSKAASERIFPQISFFFRYKRHDTDTMNEYNCKKRITAGLTKVLYLLIYRPIAELLFFVAFQNLHQKVKLHLSRKSKSGRFLLWHCHNNVTNLFVVMSVQTY